MISFLECLVKGKSNCSCSALVICVYGMTWHGEQEGPAAEGVELAGCRYARTEWLSVREGSFPWWWQKKCRSVAS